MATTATRPTRWGIPTSRFRPRREYQNQNGVGRMGATSPLDPIQALVSQARAQYLAGDVANAQVSINAAQAQNDALVAQQGGGSTGLEDNIQVVASMIAGQSSTNISAGTVSTTPQDIAATQTAIAQAIQNQPGLLDKLGASSFDMPLSAISPILAAIAPNATVGDALTWYGGYTSALGITTPQSGRDAAAMAQAQKNIDNTKKAIVSNLPWPLSWIAANPGMAASIAAGIGLAVYAGPPAIRAAKSGGRAVRS
jgi:hypothetical protein